MDGNLANAHFRFDKLKPNFCNNLNENFNMTEKWKSIYSSYSLLLSSTHLLICSHFSCFFSELQPSLGPSPNHRWAACFLYTFTEVCGFRCLLEALKPVFMEIRVNKVQDWDSRVLPVGGTTKALWLRFEKWLWRTVNNHVVSDVTVDFYCIKTDQDLSRTLTKSCRRLNDPEVTASIAKWCILMENMLSVNN